MARSRRPWGLPSSGAPRSLSTSPTVRTLGRASQVEGEVSSEEGSFLKKPLRTRNLKNDFRAEISLARDLADSPPELARWMKRTRTFSSTAHRPNFRALRKPRNFSRSLR